MNPTQTPTEPGWFYWASSTTNGKWYCEYINQTPAGKLFVQSTLSDVDTTGGFWGGKVPSPGTTWSVGEIKEWLLGKKVKDNGCLPKILEDQNATLQGLIVVIDDYEAGIAATTQRNEEKR